MAKTDPKKTRTRSRVTTPARSVASDPAALKKLAGEINSLTTSAHDALVSMAIKLAEAQALCKAAKLPFADWCAANLTISYDYATRLAGKGAEKDPARAIEDMRATTAAKVRKHAAKRKTGLANPNPPKGKSQSYTAPGRGEYQRALSSMGIETRKAELASLLAAFGVRLTWETDQSALAA